MNKGTNKTHNEGYLDLRELIERFDEMGELSRVKGADWNMEIGALSETVAGSNPGRAKALLFDDIPGYPAGFRILSGAANAYKRLALVLGLPEPENEMDLVHAYRDKAKRKFELLPPVEVQEGPILENIDREEEVDLWKFPAPFVHERDGGRYIGTDDLVIMRDPDSGWINVGTYRVMVHDKNTVAIWMSPGKHGRLISEKYFSKAENCPVLISCGHDPNLFLVAHQEVDYELDEFAYAGGQRGKPIEVIQSELHKLPIPAYAELVLEGEIIADEMREEGPFGEFMGYYASGSSELPIVKIKRVYWRKNPIITLAVPSRPPENFTFARATVKSAMIWDEVEKAGLPGVRGVWCHESGAGRLFNVISIEQLYPGHATQAGMLAANCHAGNYAGRWVIVVDEDIDPSNLFDVTWAMSTRCDPPEDIQFVKRSWSTPLDPLLREPPWQNNRAIVDACRPYGWKDDFPKVAEASFELKSRIRKKFPEFFDQR
tara:strand:- start:342 stop:1805 length:1464 start_codon:yes stop_codon:yes gene_type:complete